jgi:hypothetical protein
MVGSPKEAKAGKPKATCCYGGILSEKYLADRHLTNRHLADRHLANPMNDQHNSALSFGLQMIDLL